MEFSFKRLIMSSFYLDVLSENPQRTLMVLGGLPLLKKFYLAGGTATALYLGHRISGDLDFFTQENFDESLLVQKLSEAGKFQLEKKSEQTAIGILDGTKISFLGYTYPILLPLKKVMDSINIADIIDIACMKVDTISSRGAKRDFVDLYFIIKELFSLEKILESFAKKYASINYNMMHIKKSLVYFEGAETDPMPKMLKPANWEEIKTFFQKEVKKIA